MSEFNWTEVNYVEVDENGKEKKTKPKFLKEIQTKLNNGKVWAENHPEYILLFGPMILGAGISLVGGTAKFIRKQSGLKKQKDLKELYVYDPSLGHYWRLKRKLNNSDWVKIEDRRQKGQALGTILNDLKVLK